MGMKEAASMGRVRLNKMSEVGRVHRQTKGVGWDAIVGGGCAGA